MLSSAASSMQNFYQRAVLEYDGVFRHYVYPKESSSITEKWSMSWNIFSSTPLNVCEITEDPGSGACGFNSFCRLGNDHRPTCQCPRGYIFLDPNNSMQGCKQNFSSQNCDDSNHEVDLFDFKEMQNADWPRI
ncbi:G-type lectin S-receptor-like serine/threonine-protein kinase [Melia azedarach]|uniref:G-type lectin S-receptor-like serine/threonine-protein kinase n=1 Tax=Melia azedarach TaxID=155640 RepID=A0ACC1YL44_MELAZ|nr:G-type lectin S-receptor-like serine/threonine-protein kinase [Melia azedarach]